MGFTSFCLKAEVIRGEGTSVSGWDTGPFSCREGDSGGCHVLLSSPLMSPVDLPRHCPLCSENDERTPKKYSKDDMARWNLMFPCVWPSMLEYVSMSSKKGKGAPGLQNARAAHLRL